MYSRPSRWQTMSATNIKSPSDRQTNIQTDIKTERFEYGGLRCTLGLVKGNPGFFPILDFPQKRQTDRKTDGHQSDRRTKIFKYHGLRCNLELIEGGPVFQPIFSFS